MTLSYSDFDYVRNLVLKRSAIVLGDEKAYLAESRLLNLARREGYPGVDALVAQLRGGGPPNGLLQKVVEAMTTNETSFFRDIQPFEALRKVVLPELARTRQANQQLHVWCAACSTGQEPYSLAMLLREHFPQLHGWDVRILATDLSTEVLAKARAGSYGQIEVNRGLPATLLVKYFQRQGVNWQLKDDVRKMIDFRQMNLIEAWPAMPQVDVVLLRNVLIYFDVAVKKEILARVRRLLRPDGYLFLGGAESTFNLDDGFERVELERTSVYRLVQR